jgi:hypothetical protein
VKKKTSMSSEQGCQIFLGATYRNWKNIPNGHEIYQMTVTFTKLPVKYPYVVTINYLHYITFSNPRPSKIYPIWDFWCENIPSGNPGSE